MALDSLEDITKYFEKRKEQRENRVEGRWLFLKDGQSERIYIASELDAGADNYNEAVGRGIVAVEHQIPNHFPRRFECTRNDDDGEQCYGCELKAEAYDSPDGNKDRYWLQKTSLYLNVLVENDKGELEPAMISQGSGPSTVTDQIIDMAVENGTIVGWYKFSRKGQGKQTKYTLTQVKGDEVDVEEYKWPVLKDRATLHLPYEEQIKFVEKLLGSQSSKPEPAVVASSTTDEDDEDW